MNSKKNELLNMIKIVENQTLSNIIQSVEERAQITYEAMKRRTRRREIVQARMMCYALIREFMPHMTLIEIGAEFGGYDHTSVRHGIITVKDLEDVDKWTREAMEDCRTRIAELERGNLEFDINSSSGLALAQFMEFETQNVRAARLHRLV